MIEIFSEIRRSEIRNSLCIPHDWFPAACVFNRLPWQETAAAVLRLFNYSLYNEACAAIRRVTILQVGRWYCHYDSGLFRNSKSPACAKQSGRQIRNPRAERNPKFQIPNPKFPYVLIRRRTILLLNKGAAAVFQIPILLKAVIVISHFKQTVSAK
jgi:hypothetical protein